MYCRIWEKETPKAFSTKGAKIALLTIVAVVVLVTFFTMALTLTQMNEPNDEEINPQNIVITSKHLGVDSIGVGNLFATIDVSVYNDGDPGTVVVWAEVGHELESHSRWDQHAIIYLDSHDSRDLRFVFPIYYPTPCGARHSIVWRVWVSAP